MIKQIRLKEYLTCKNVNIVMQEPLMALLGKNAVGKTNTLKGIQLLASYMWGLKTPTKGFSGEFTIQHKADNLIYVLKILGKKGAYVRDSLHLIVDGKRVEIFDKKRKIELTVTGFNKPIFLHDRMTGLGFLHGVILSKEKKPDFLATILKRYQGHISTVVFDLFRVRYYGVQNQPSLGLLGREEYEEWLKDPYSEDTKNLLACQYYDFFKNHQERFDEYNTLVKSLGVVDAINVLELSGDTKFEKRYLCGFLFDVHGESLIFDELSDGTKRVLRLLFHLLYDRPSLMLVEEPESSIHHGLLVQLLSIFQQYSNDRKVLITTHSEQIMSELKPEQLIYLYIDRGTTQAKYLTGRTLRNVRRYLNEVGPLGEYVTSGELETDFED